MTNQNQTPTNDETLSFEDAYREIEEIVDRLESGELTLAESLSLFERGQKLLVLCTTRLDSAELRISQLSGGEPGA